MKKNLVLYNFKLFAITIISLSAMVSCQKESLKTSAVNANASSNSRADIKELILASGFLDKASASVERSYQNPGIDTMTDFPGDSTLSIYAWTVSGQPVFGRSFIKFKGLYQIPAQSQVVSATLHLTGITPGNISMPQGDSYYPGSPYPNNNSLVISGITENWSAKNLTWNNQPATTTKGAQLIPASTQQWNYNVSVDVTELVSEMVAHPAFNYGFELQCRVEKYYRSMGFYSSQYADSTKRPTLIVHYN